MLMLRFAHFECNKIFGHNDFMLGFCTAPENWIPGIYHKGKKMQPPAIWASQQSICRRQMFLD